MSKKRYAVQVWSHSNMEVAVHGLYQDEHTFWEENEELFHEYLHTSEGEVPEEYRRENWFWSDGNIYHESGMAEDLDNKFIVQELDENNNLVGEQMEWTDEQIAILKEELELENPMYELICETREIDRQDYEHFAVVLHMSKGITRGIIVETDEPFDPRKLQYVVSEVPGAGDVIDEFRYDGKDCEEYGDYNYSDGTSSQAYLEEWN